jgi:hypothetical protein
MRENGAWNRCRPLHHIFGISLKAIRGRFGCFDQTMKDFADYTCGVPAAGEEAAGPAELDFGGTGRAYASLDGTFSSASAWVRRPRLVVDTCHSAGYDAVLMPRFDARSSGKQSDPSPEHLYVNGLWGGMLAAQCRFKPFGRLWLYKHGSSRTVTRTQQARGADLSSLTGARKIS